MPLFMNSTMHIAFTFELLRAMPLPAVGTCSSGVPPGVPAAGGGVVMVPAKGQSMECPYIRDVDSPRGVYTVEHHFV